MEEDHRMEGGHLREGDHLTEGHHLEEQATLTQEGEDRRSQEGEDRLSQEEEEAAEVHRHLEDPSERGCPSRTASGIHSSSYRPPSFLKLSSVKRLTVPSRSGMCWVLPPLNGSPAFRNSRVPGGTFRTSLVTTFGAVLRKDLECVLGFRVSPPTGKAG